jgi:hypothetical protein
MFCQIKTITLSSCEKPNTLVGLSLIGFKAERKFAIALLDIRGFGVRNRWGLRIVWWNRSRGITGESQSEEDGIRQYMSYISEQDENLR